MEGAGRLTGSRVRNRHKPSFGGDPLGCWTTAHNDEAFWLLIYVHTATNGSPRTPHDLGRCKALSNKLNIHIHKCLYWTFIFTSASIDLRRASDCLHKTSFIPRGPPVQKLDHQVQPDLVSVLQLYMKLPQKNIHICGYLLLQAVTNTHEAEFTKKYIFFIRCPCLTFQGFQSSRVWKY